MPIRQPSPARQLYAWHTAAVTGENPPRHVDWPECGWFKRRLVQGGRWVAFRIVCRRETDPETGELLGPERLIALDAFDTPSRAAPIWTHLHPITKTEHDQLARFQRENQHIAMDQPVDLGSTPTLPPQRTQHERPRTSV